MNWKSFSIELINKYNQFILGYLTVLNIIYVVLLLLSCWGLYFYIKRSSYEGYHEMLSSSFLPSISILVPAFNEEKTIVENVESLLSLEYSSSEIIVINDGSDDDTLERLIDNFGLTKVDQVYKRIIASEEIKGIYLSATVPNLTIIDKENGGKADALNAGINLSQYELVTAIDADSILENDSLLKIARPFIEKPEKVVATGGMVRIANGSQIDRGFVEEVSLSDNPLALFQTIEYLRAFLTGRVGWSLVNGLLIVSGAFGLFNKKILAQVGGYISDTIGEDMELVVRIHQYMLDEDREYSIEFVPDAVCWTQAPSNLSSLASQRKRWQRGLMDTLLSHWDLLFNPHYGKIGMIIVPYYWIFEMFGPVIELLGYFSFLISLLLGISNIEFALLFFTLAVLYGVLISVSTVLLEAYTSRKYKKGSAYLKLICYSIVENFGYRQLATLWRVISIFGYKIKENNWGNIKREEFKNT